MQITIWVCIFVMGIIGAGLLLMYFPRGFAGLILSVAIDGLLWRCGTQPSIKISDFLLILLIILEIWGTALLFFWDERLLHPLRLRK